MEFTDVVADVLDVDPAQIVDHASPATVDNWTSLRHVQLVVTLEEVYGISFSREEIQGFKSIRNVRETLLSKGAAL